MPIMENKEEHARWHKIIKSIQDTDDFEEN